MWPGEEDVRVLGSSREDGGQARPVGDFLIAGGVYELVQYDLGGDGHDEEMLDARDRSTRDVSDGLDDSVA
jgi:hypothetical protein